MISYIFTPTQSDKGNTMNSYNSKTVFGFNNGTWTDYESALDIGLDISKATHIVDMGENWDHSWNSSLGGTQAIEALKALLGLFYFTIN